MDEAQQIRASLNVKETSVLYKFFTCATVVFSSVIALWAIEWPTETGAILLLTPVGFIFSHHYSNGKNIPLKIIISILMLFSLANFFNTFLTNPLGPAASLSLLLLWLQTLHSFDLPKSRDLKYSLAVSVMLIITGAFFVSDIIYIALATLFFALFFISYFFAANSFSSAIVSLETQKTNAQDEKKLIGWGVLIAAIATFSSIAVGTLFFILIPRAEIANIRTLNLEKFRFGSFFRQKTEQSSASSLGTGGQKLNKISAAASGYFGFGDVMDLNFRGRLSDDIVIKVKTSFPSYYRGAVFTNYDGSSWKIPSSEISMTDEINAFDDVIFLGMPHRRDSKRIIQVFNIEKDLSNIIYSANCASQLYFPGNQLYIGPNRELFSPYYLEKGMSYVCVSERGKRLPTFNIPITMRRNKGTRNWRFFREQMLESCLRLPPISDRLKKFAAQFDRYKSDYDKAKAICESIKTSCSYDLNIDKFPTGAETADYFLFEEKKGFCEHFATAMAVVCRLNGIPCRVVTGFPEGTYNPFTGFYEIKESDAHAWIEIITETGLIEFDPTPGYAGEITAKEYKSGVETTLASIKTYLEPVLRSKTFGLFMIFIFTGSATAALILRAQSGKRQTDLRKSRETKQEKLREITSRKNIAEIAEPIFKALKKYGFYRQERQTVNEFVNSLNIPEPLLSDMNKFFQNYEKLRYSLDISEENISKAQIEAEQISRRLKNKRRNLCRGQT